MSYEKRSAIARRGGIAAQKCGRAHRWTKDEAANYAGTGGIQAHALGVAHEWTSEEAEVAGRKGGKTKRRKKLET